MKEEKREINSISHSLPCWPCPLYEIIYIDRFFFFVSIQIPSGIYFMSLKKNLLRKKDINFFFTFNLKIINTPMSKGNKAKATVMKVKTKTFMKQKQNMRVKLCGEKNIDTTTLNSSAHGFIS